MSRLEPLKVAIVHDWLYGGGAERVTYELHKMFPDAPIYTSYCSDEWRKKLDGKVVTGFLQHWPFSKLRKYLAVFRIWWVEHLDMSSYDLVISVSGNGEAFGVKIGPDTLHINYCHTPTHYYWRHYEQFLKHPGFGVFNPLARIGLRLLVRPLRKWDYRAAQRADYIIANSTHIQKDIKKYYGRDSVVIHPPVDIARFTKQKTAKKRTGFITVGRLAPQKRTDIVVAACTKLGLPLTVVGRGPELAFLRRMAGPTVKFDTNASDQKVNNYMAGAQAFLFASHEDFGITPVEALAAGTPVIAFKAGGALDYVIENKNGTFFEQQTAESLAQALQSFDPNKFNAREVSRSAEQFAPEQFAKKMRTFIEQCLASKH